MITPNFIELFEIEAEHIKPPNKIWNLTLQKWCKTSTEFVKNLLLLIEAREAIKMYDEHLHNPMNMDSCRVHIALCDKVTEARKKLDGKANLFCILHKGYSLN